MKSWEVLFQSICDYTTPIFDIKCILGGPCVVEADLNDKLEEGLIGLEDVPYPALLGIKVSNCFMKLNACWSIMCDITFRPNSVKIHGINYYTRKAITKR